MIITSTPMSDFKRKMKQIIDFFKADAARKYSYSSTVASLFLTLVASGFAASLESDNNPDVALGKAMGIVGIGVGARFIVPGIMTLREKIRDIAQKDREEFIASMNKTSIDDGGKEKTLDAKIGKLLKELSNDYEKFERFVELTDLSYDDVKKIKTLTREAEPSTTEKDKDKTKENESVRPHPWCIADRWNSSNFYNFINNYADLGCASCAKNGNGKFFAFFWYNYSNKEKCSEEKHGGAFT